MLGSSIDFRDSEGRGAKYASKRWKAGAPGRDRPRLFSVLVLILVLPVVASCSKIHTALPPPVSKTKQIEKASAPPRTIQDILTEIGRAKKGDLKSIARARSLAGRPPPRTNNGRVLSKFFLRRARAARKLGLVRQEIANYRQAIRYHGERSAVSSRKIQTIFRLGVAEFRASQHARGIDLVRKAIDLQGKKEKELVWSAALARLSAETGDLAAAGEALRRAENLYAESTSWKWSTPHSRRYWKANLMAAQGRLLDLKGRPLEAEPLLREAVKVYSSYKNWPKGLGRNLKHLETTYREFLGFRVENLRRRGRFIEAEAESRKVLRHALRTDGRFSFATASAIRELIRILSEQGRYEEAEKLARSNLKIYRKINGSSKSNRSAEARVDLANVISAQGRWHEALAHFETLRKELEGDPATYQKFLVGNLNLAMAMMVAERPERAIEVLRVAKERSVFLFGENHFETAMIRGAMGAAYARLGARQRANLEFGRSIPLLLRRAADAEGGGARLVAQEPWLDLIIESFISFLAGVFRTPLERGGGKRVAEEAFRLTSLVRNLDLQRAMRAAAAAAARKDPELARFAHRMQSAQRQIGALTDLLANAASIPADQQNPFVIETLRSKIARLRTSRSRLIRQIARRFPAYARLTHPKPSTVRLARSALRPGEAMISIYMGQERIYLWAIPHKGKVVFSAKAPGRWQIEPAVAELRRALHSDAQTLKKIPAYNLELGYELYKTLLAPVRAGWRRARSLFIVTHGALRRLPFSALPTKPVRLNRQESLRFSNYRKVPWLVRRAAVTMLPSVASLKTLRTRPPGSAKRRPFIGFGAPLFGGNRPWMVKKPGMLKEKVASRKGDQAVGRDLPLEWRSLRKVRELNSLRLPELSHLPETAVEVRSVARAVRADLTRDIYLGSQASEDLLKTMDLTNRKVVLFATHGLLPGDLNGLTQPAIALSNPGTDRVGSDGLLTMDEVLGLRLDADWVVLPAFGGANGKVSGEKTIAALERAFFYAGARALLMSNWPVEATSARRLMTDLFRRQTQAPRRQRAIILRRAMLALLDGEGYVDKSTGKTVFSYAHPIFWAPFTIVGDGGRPAIARN